MLRLIIAAVLASVCLAYPQRRDGAPAEDANLQPFDMGTQGLSVNALPANPGSPGMASAQYLPFNPNFRPFGFKRADDENLEKRRLHSKFNNDNNFPFNSEMGNFMNFMKDDGNNLPFAGMDSAPNDLGNFEPSAENTGSKFRFFDKQQ